MAVVDMDSLFVRAIKYLHSSAPDSQYYLGLLLDEEIKNAYGVNAELSAILNLPPMEHPVVTAPVQVFDTVISEVKDESRTCSSSDNELELDLLKEDLMCIVCKGMDVSAKNQLLECGECHSLYHQECHDPPIFQDEIEANPLWICSFCKKQIEALKIKSILEKPGPTLKIAAPPSPPITTIFPERDIPERTTVKAVTSKSVAQTVSTTKQSILSTSSSFPNRAVTPNISIICADKRLQIMKKKAAKMQEKRKLSNR